jgi:hypothetical protein
MQPLMPKKGAVDVSLSGHATQPSVDQRARAVPGMQGAQYRSRSLVIASS